MLKIYGVAASQPVRAVLWAAMMKDLPFEFVTIMPGSKKEGGTRHEDFLKLNPIGNVPVIDDGTIVLAESHAILTYLASKHGWTDLCVPPRCPLPPSHGFVVRVVAGNYLRCTRSGARWRGASSGLGAAAGHDRGLL